MRKYDYVLRCTQSGKLHEKCDIGWYSTQNSHIFSLSDDLTTFSIVSAFFFL